MPSNSAKDGEMVFGGYGRKTKLRGEVFFPCMECSALNAFGLVENYGYGQLYGVRLAKYKSNRYLLCSQCQEGYELSKDQWGQAILISDGLKRRHYELTMKEMAASAVELARRLFPDRADYVRGLLWEQLEEPPPIDESDHEVEPDALAVLTAASEELKTCPDCAEQIKAGARKCRYCGYLFVPVDNVVEADHASEPHT